MDIAMTDAIFTQREYNSIVDALDQAIAAIRATGKSEKQAQEMLKDFVENHYYKVWRAMAVNGQQTTGKP